LRCLQGFLEFLFLSTVKDMLGLQHNRSTSQKKYHLLMNYSQLLKTDTASDMIIFFSLMLY